jgi:hypothetical protein
MSLELWMHGISPTDPQGSLERMRDLGFTTVVLGGNKEQLALAKSLGFNTYACTGTFSRSKDFQDEGYLAVDVEGTPREWFGSTCPNEKAVRRANLSTIEGILSDTEAEGLMLDGCRFASPASGLGAFFTCFCHRCQARANELGYDFKRMKMHATQVYRTLADGRLGKEAPDLTPFAFLSSITGFPGIADWLSFRATCAIEHFSNVSDLVRGMGAKMGAYIFTPSLSVLVGQRYSSLTSLFDMASPMIYRNYPDTPGPACINKESAQLARFLQRGGLDDASAASTIAGFLGMSEEGRSISEIDQGTSTETIRRELLRAKDNLRGVSKIVPILYLGDEQVITSVNDAADIGLDGVDFFLYKDEWVDAIELISKQVG